MGISFDKALGIHEHTLSLRSKRAEVIANNLANADTPGYKAQALDFDKALQNALSGHNKGLLRTHEKHISSSASSSAFSDVIYSVPNQPDTGDGNTVDSQKEMAKFAENAMEYQTTLMFLSKKFKGMKTALKGE